MTLSLFCCHVNCFQVLLGFVTNALWYLSMMSEPQFEVEPFRAAMVVVSSLVIFFRLFFNSTKVGVATQGLPWQPFD